MSNSPYTLLVLPAAGPSITGVSVATSMLVASSPAAGQIRAQIPANWLGYGTRITFDAHGILTTAAATQGTGTWGIWLGTVATPIIVASTPVTATLTASMASWKWQVHFDITLRIVGVTTVAQFWSQGWFAYAASATTEIFTQMPYNVTPPVLGTGFDSSIVNVFDAFYTPSVTTQTLVCEQACAVIWNPNY